MQSVNSGERGVHALADLQLTTWQYRQLTINYWGNKKLTPTAELIDIRKKAKGDAVKKRFAIKDISAKLTAIIAHEGSRGTSRRFDSADGANGIFRFIAENYPNHTTQNSLKSNVHSGTVTDLQSQAIAATMEFESDCPIWRDGSVIEFKAVLSGLQATSQFGTLEVTRARPNNPNDHLASIQIHAAQLNGAVVRSGERVALLFDLRFNVSRMFPELSNNIALSLCHVRLRSQQSEFSDIAEDLNTEDVRSNHPVSLKARGAESPYWEISSKANTLDCVVQAVLACVTVPDGPDTITSAVSAFVKNLNAPKVQALDSFASANGDALDDIAQERMIERLQAMALAESEPGLVMLGEHALKIRIASDKTE